MRGQLGEPRVGVVPAQRLERLRDLSVQTRTTRDAESVVEGVTDERVGEGETTGRRRNLVDERSLDGLLEERQDAVLVVAEGRREKVEVEVLADDRSHAEGLGDIIPESGDAPADDLVDALGQVENRGVVGHPPATVLLVDTARLREVAEHLHRVEGVSVGLLMEGMRERDPLGVELVPGGCLHEVDEVDVVDPVQLDPFDTRLAIEARECIVQVQLRRHIVVPVRADDEHAQALGRRDQMPEQQERRFVGPVQVVEDDDDRLVT